MPILAAETTIFPENLFDDALAGSSNRRWWALHTKARQEKALARQLLRREIPFYLPLVAKEHLARGRRVRSFIPLFGGYIFLYGTEQERVYSLTTNRISNMLAVTDGDELRCDLHDVRKLIASDAPLTVERRLAPGQHVRIKGGSMTGMEGTVIHRRGKTRLVVAVHFLQQGVSIEIEDFLLEPIG